jgi:hypothetical protein
MEGIRSFLTPAPAPNPPTAGGGGLGGGVGATPPTVAQPNFASAGTGGGGTPCNIVVPIMGDVIEQHTSKGGEWVAWTGGKPAFGWTGLDTTVAAVAPTPTMYRNIGILDVKGYAHRIKGMETKFGMKDDLRAFQRGVMKHFRRCGMDTITYLPDPANPTEIESVVESPNWFTKEYVTGKMGEYEARYDEYDRLNARTASDFVLNSLSPEMERKVTEALVSTPNPSFLLIWMTMIEKIRLLSVARFDNLEKRIKARKLTDYPGQNLDLMAEANLRDLLDLQQGGWFSVSTGVDMAKNFASANTDCFEFKQYAYKIVSEYKEAVKECYYLSQQDRVIHMEAKGLDFESICVKFGEYYLPKIFVTPRFLPAIIVIWLQKR